MPINYDAVYESRKISKLLIDEESRMIYEKSLLYSMAGNVFHKYEILGKSFCDFLYRILKIPDEAKIVIYGCNNNSWQLYEAIYDVKKTRQILGVVVDEDSSELKFYDLPIICFDEFGAFCEVNSCCDKDIIVICGPEYKDKALNKEWDVPVRDTIALEEIVHIGTQYYLDKIPYSDKEIFVDAGCYRLETVRTLNRFITFEKVYAFEPDSINAEVISEMAACNYCNTRDIEVHNIGLWDQKAELSFSSDGTQQSRIDRSGNGQNCVIVDALDNVLKGRKVTYIKMDIEGAELKALIGSKETIQRFRPKLAICVYHSPEDIITIPSYINSLNMDYRFYLRHYSCNSAETVLYAV